MVTVRANIYGTLDTEMVVLKLCCWNLTQRNCRLYLIEVDFYSEKRNRFLNHHLELRGNVRNPTIVRWKARGRLCIRPN